MTLPAAFPLSMSQIAGELGLSLPLSMNHPWVIALANKSALPVSFSDLLGKSGRFDGNVSIGSSQAAFGPLSGQLFGAPLAQLQGVFNGALLTEVLILFANGTFPPTFNGNFKLINNTVGQSCICTHQSPGSNTWQNTSPPGSIIRPNTNDNFTILPA